MIRADRSEWFDQMKAKATPGMALRVYRRNAGLSQIDLESQTGILKENISGMETGKRPIGKAIAKRLAEALDCDYRSLL